MKRVLALTCILFWVVAGKAESIDQRNFALDTFSPTPNDVRVAEKRVQTYWNKHKAQYGANTRYLAVELRSPVQPLPGSWKFPLIGGKSRRRFTYGKRCTWRCTSYRMARL